MFAFVAHAPAQAAGLLVRIGPRMRTPRGGACKKHRRRACESHLEASQLDVANAISQMVGN